MNMQEMNPVQLFEFLKANTTCDPCQSCPKNSGQPTNSTDLVRRAMVLLHQHDVSIDFISLIAGMLTDGWNVTVVHLVNDHKIASSQHALEERILSSVPCCDESVSRKMLKVVLIDTGTGLEACADQISPFDSCTLDQALDMHHLLESFWQRQETNDPTYQQPHVILTDATFLGGLLISEAKRIPCVALATHHAFRAVVEHDPQWIPRDRNMITRGIQILKQRVQSLSLTSSFIRLNLIRRELNLTLLRVPIQYFQPIVAVLIGFLDDSDVRYGDEDGALRQLLHRPNLIHQTGPLQLPCIPCIPSPASSSSSRRRVAQQKPSSNNNTIIIFAQPPNLSRMAARNLILGFSMVRSSLENYDECEWDPMTCRNEARGFDVHWMKPQIVGQVDKTNNESRSTNNSTIPNVVPPFIKVDSSASLIDTFIQKTPFVAAIVAHCDAETETLSLLGVPLVCISQSNRLPPKEVTYRWESSATRQSRELALQLLKTLRKSNIKTASLGQATPPATELGGGNDSLMEISKQAASHKHSPLHALPQALSVLSRVADAQRDHGPWKKLSEMTEVIESVLVDPNLPERDDDQLYDTFTVLVAWLVLLTSIAYIGLKDSCHWRYGRRGGHRGDALSDGILARLPDLDDAWTILLQWYGEQPSLRPSIAFQTEDPVDAHTSVPLSSGLMDGHNNGSVRRRKRR